MNPIFYKKPIVLDSIKHVDWKFEPLLNYSFAKDTNSIYLMLSEFPLASREYPIVFGKNNNGYFPIVLVGIKKDFNSYVLADGTWNASYIPAYVRRYPFIISPIESKEDEYCLCIDSEYEGLNSTEATIRLFNDKNEPSDTVKKVIEFTQSYKNEADSTNDFCTTISDLDLFEESVIQSNDGNVSLSGFYTINKAKFSKIKAKDLKLLHDKGFLEHVFSHILSLSLIKNIVN